MKVEIKERRLPTGNRSLYLEYYETGFRKKEYLGIFLVPEDSARARRLNGEALRKAQEIKSKRILCPPDFKSEERKKHQKKDTVNPTWLEWCDEYIRWSEDCGNSKKMLQHKGVVRKRIASYLENRGKKGILHPIPSTTSQKASGSMPPTSTVSSSLPRNSPASSAWRQPPAMSGRCSLLSACRQ